MSTLKAAVIRGGESQSSSIVAQKDTKHAPSPPPSPGPPPTSTSKPMGTWNLTRTQPAGVLPFQATVTPVYSNCTITLLLFLEASGTVVGTKESNGQSGQNLISTLSASSPFLEQKSPK